MSQKPYHHGDLRNALLTAASGLLAENGPEGLSLREVARRAGVSPNAPYRHFENRDALLGALATRAFRELVSRFKLLPPMDPRERLSALGEEYVRFAREHRAEYAIMFGSHEGFEFYPDLKEASGEAFFILIQTVQEILPPGATQSDAVRYSLVVWSMIHGFAELENMCAFQFIDESAIPKPTEFLSLLAQLAPERP